MSWIQKVLKDETLFSRDQHALSKKFWSVIDNIPIYLYFEKDMNVNFVTLQNYMTIKKKPSAVLYNIPVVYVYLFCGFHDICAFHV